MLDKTKIDHFSDSSILLKGHFATFVNHGDCQMPIIISVSCIRIDSLLI